MLLARTFGSLLFSTPGKAMAVLSQQIKRALIHIQGCLELIKQQQPRPEPQCTPAVPAESPSELVHRRLKAAALQGDTSEAEAVLQQLQDAGLPPGPAAYHSLIFSYVRAGKAEEALQAVRREWNAGAPTAAFCVIHWPEYSSWPLMSFATSHWLNKYGAILSRSSSSY